MTTDLKTKQFKFSAKTQNYIVRVKCELNSKLWNKAGKNVSKVATT